ncbi:MULTISPECIES: M28 family peptidase [Metallosphaera]|uniref:Peptidase M28 n=3 Tax=Metallosphaera TaxID=41980 RepID=A4YGJ9_METS5|nr:MULTISPECIES: M28 family peptidase [Metallosphaera]ABP95551.1 peptidase M28 [Metallosphaera sedula DSM 5348]AIM27535.1 peptidase M28 [Metallosphaera sedula]AKV75350.1 peptidase M28 [Metallosphaera sedula]AKV77593.1 peptidase M28 [Metallosphaera sedula]AKV79838.1 peptidase M28 [Metallosphaera sedula]
MELARQLFNLGEAIHGGPEELKILEKLEELFPDYESIPVNTKFWDVRFSEILANGQNIPSVAMPYTSGCVKGRVGREIGLFPMPSHPFDLKNLPLSQYEGVIIVEEGKLRRITLPQGSPPTFFASRNVDGYVELCSDTRLVEANSRNLEITLREGDSYILLGAHVDHWLSGFHDNILSVQLLVDMKKDLERSNLRHGVKLVFFSSEEGPRCCTGSSQFPVKDAFAVISLDAIYPSRVVFSGTPDLWFLSKHFPLKRVEMPTPFSDHYPFVQRGIPGLVLYNDDMTTVYHSDADVPTPLDPQYLEVLRKSLVEALRELDSTPSDRLDEEFFRHAKLAGYTGDTREGALIPDPSTLTTKFKRI